MRIEIETYKGQSIEYDDDNDKFVCDISVEDEFKTTKRQSLKDVRKEIDQFVKLNMDFKPFKAIEVSKYGSDSYNEVFVEGIRTDGKYIVSQRGSSYKSHYEQKDMVRLRVFDQDIMEEKERLEKEVDDLRKANSQKIKDMAANLKPLSL